MVQAGIAASQGAFASYQQLQNVTRLYAINMQFNASQVKLLFAADAPALVGHARSQTWIEAGSKWPSEVPVKAAIEGSKATG